MSLVKDIGNAPSLREEIALRDKAMAGDMVFVVTPATVGRAATAAAWTREVVIELQAANGDTHSWFDKAIANGVSIGDTSNAGTATIAATTLTFVKGRATVTVTGSAHAWIAAETDTLTVAQATILGNTIAAKTSVQTFA